MANFEICGLVFGKANLISSSNFLRFCKSVFTTVKAEQPCTFESAFYDKENCIQKATTDSCAYDSYIAHQT